MNLWLIGGAIGAVGPEETAFFERSAPFMVEITGNWSDRSKPPAGSTAA